MPSYTKAPCRRRPKRIQKKIDKRYGLLRCDKRAIYILSLTKAMALTTLALSTSIVSAADDSMTLSKLGRGMLDIVKDANQVNNV